MEAARALRHENVRTILEAFGDDHRATRELLDQAILGGEALHRLRTHAMFGRFAAELRRHIRAEEEALIPAFEAHTGLRDIGPTILIHREHCEIERRLDQIGTMLDRNADLRLVTPLLSALRALLLEHDRREERVLYPACDRFFTDAERCASLDALQDLGAP